MKFSFRLFSIFTFLFAGNVFAQSAYIVKYPALPSPNVCTEDWGDDYFMRSNGYCQRCASVSPEYQEYYKICSFTEIVPEVMDVEPEYISCYSTKTGTTAYKECAGRSVISKAEIFQDFGESECRFDITWGYFENMIWASRGCIAKIEVCYLDEPCHLDQVATVPVNPPVITPETPACTASKPAGWISYRVQAGDNLSSLARRTGSYTETLRHVNCIENPNFIVSGTLLYLPRQPDPIITRPVILPPPPTDIVDIAPVETDRPEDDDSEDENEDEVFISNAAFLGLENKHDRRSDRDDD